MLFLYLMSVHTDEEAVETFPEKLICESCGESFSCGSKIGECWCFEIDLTDKTLAKLQEDFKDCLCPNCLVKRKDQPQQKVCVKL